MINVVRNNLHKFKYEKINHDFYCYVYKDIAIEIHSLMFPLGSIYELRYKDKLISLTFTEKIKLEKIVKILNKMRNNNFKQEIVKELKEKTYVIK